MGGHDDTGFADNSACALRWPEARQSARQDSAGNHRDRQCGTVAAAAIPLARDALTDWLTVVIAVGTVILLLVSKIDTLWIVLGSAALTLGASSFGLIAHASGVQ
jgi:hypothetical protein